MKCGMTCLKYILSYSGSFLKEALILDSVFGDHFLTTHLLVPCFWFPGLVDFQVPFFVRILFLATFYVVLYRPISRLCYHMSTKKNLVWSVECKVIK